MNPLIDHSSEISTAFFSAFRPNDQDAHGEEVRDTLRSFLRFTMFSITPAICVFMSTADIERSWEHVPFSTEKPVSDCLKWCLLNDTNAVFFLQLLGLLRNDLVPLRIVSRVKFTHFVCTTYRCVRVAGTRAHCMNMRLDVNNISGVVAAAGKAGSGVALQFPFSMIHSFPGKHPVACWKLSSIT